MPNIDSSNVLTPDTLDRVLGWDSVTSKYVLFTAAELFDASGKADTDHTHTADDITDFAEAVDDRVDALLVAGSGIAITYDDALGSLTISTAGGSGSGGAVADGPAVRLTNSVTQSVQDDASGNDSVDLDTEVFDADGIAAGGTLTISDAGTYLVIARVNIQADDTDLWLLYVKKNASTDETDIAIAYASGPTSLAGSVSLPVATLVELAVGDTLSLAISQNSGAAVNVSGGMANVEFSAVRVAS